ncbi:MAG: S-layer homology domain-containing protein [Clostridiales bacterium]|nr:S-layer homology domain-containing protein [Clostridiales bacterium]
MDEREIDYAVALYYSPYDTTEVDFSDVVGYQMFSYAGRDVVGSFAKDMNKEGFYMIDVTDRGGYTHYSQLSPSLEYHIPNKRMDMPTNVRWDANGSAQIMWDWPTEDQEFKVSLQLTEQDSRYDRYVKGNSWDFVSDAITSDDHLNVFIDNEGYDFYCDVQALSDDILNVAHSEPVKSETFLSAKKKIDSIANPTPTPTPSPADSASYIYISEPGETVFPPIERLAEIRTVGDAGRIVAEFAQSLTIWQKASAAGVDRLERFAEEAAARAATREVSRNFIIDYDLVSSMEAQSASAREAVSSGLASSGVELNRSLRTVVRLKVSHGFAASQPGSPIISAGKTMSLLPQVTLASLLGPPTVSIDVNSNYSNAKADTVMVDTGGSILYLDKGKVESGSIGVKNQSAKTASVDFGSLASTVVTVAFPGQGKSSDYYTVTSSEGENCGGIYDPASGSFKAKINKTGVFSVVLNERDFSDIRSENAPVQKAIKSLASKGVISGRSATEYAPGAKITRAEIATLFVLILKRMDPNADGGFSDVKKSDWFFGSAGSSKKQSLISGYDDNTFRGNTVIPKTQIFAVSARMLANEMRYRAPNDTSSVLKAFSDSTSIPDWAKSDVALAELAGLVLPRTDGMFDGAEEMTRANAAVAVWKLYNKVW